MKTPRAKLMTKLELLAKEYVKKRDKWTCQYCGKVVKGSDCHASHVIPVSHSKRLSFDVLNMKVLCYHHHMNWWHKNPIEATEWFKKKFPGRYETLQERDREYIKMGSLKEYEIQEMIDKYKEVA